MKKVLVPALKFTVAAILIWWLVQTKKITAEPFIQLWATPWLTFFVFATVFVGIVVNNYRWLLLLQGQKIQSSARQTLPLTFIGLFFNLAMPGSVGGDVIKAYYIAQEQPGTKLGAATSVLMDRIVGLYAMAIIAFVAIATHSTFILDSEHLRPLAIFIILLTVGFTGFFVVGFSDRVRGHDWTNSILEKLPGGRLIERVYDGVHAFRNGKRQFIFGILLSISVQSLNIFSFYVVARTLHGDSTTLGGLFFLVPLGFIATAIPVSPGGIGVGQAVFMQLFTWYQGMSGNLGATLITIFQVVQGVWSLVGAFLYFTRKKAASTLKAGPVSGTVSTPAQGSSR